MKKSIIGILATVFGVIAFFSFKGKPSEEKNSMSRYKILQKWDLPAVLDEVSGIAWIGKNRVACVQDEDGTVFIYNLESSGIEDEIEFGSGGDYEGIAVVKEDIFVLRSDGVLFEIGNYAGENPKVEKHVTQMNNLPGINFEGLCADPENSRLLLAVKERNNSAQHKEIYEFDLNSKNSANEPVFLVDLDGPIFQNVNAPMKKKFAPGELNLHPRTGEYYILDGSEPKLLITDTNGKPKDLIMLRLADFGNPEGLTFDEDGGLYISNEAEDGPANILKVSLDRK